MSIRKILPAVIVISLFLASCVVNDRSMGKDLIPDDYTLKIHIKEFDLPVTNRVSDSVQASNKINALVGYAYDPFYGMKYSNCAVSILPYSDSTDFGVNPKLKSAYVNLYIDSVKLFDKDLEGLRQSITLYKVIRDIDSTAIFCNSLAPEDYDPVPINRSESVITGKGLLRIDLTDAFANELLSLAPEDFKDGEAFFDKIKGIYISMEKPVEGQTGGRFNYISLKSTTLYLNYILNDPERKITDLDTAETFALGYSKSYNYFHANSEHLESDNPGDKMYAESLDGVKPHIDAGALKKMLDRWIKDEGLEQGTMIISNAHVTLPYEMPGDDCAFNAEHPKMIYAFRSTPAADDTLKFYKPVSDIDRAVRKGAINRASMDYVLDITGYCQDLIGRKPEEIDAGYDLWLAPMTSYADDYKNVTYTFDNNDYSRIVLNGPTALRRPTLTITYTMMD